MDKRLYHHFIAVLQALLVTFLWSTSFILIKWGLAEIPPIIFAGLRYFIAFLCFIPFIIKKKYIDEIRNLTVWQWRKLLLLGLIFYTLTQGALFVGLSLLPAVSVTLMLNFAPLIVAVLGIVFLNEKPTQLKWLGSVLFIIGVIFYFFPITLSGSQGTGLAVMMVGVLAYAGSSILGRDINRNKNISPMIVTFISMGFGAALLLIIGFITADIPTISMNNWGLLIWLAVLNTAFAFTLWNHTLRTISAIESSIINGTMLFQIAILAWIFIDEKITFSESIGMFIAVLGAVLVQLKSKNVTS